MEDINKSSSSSTSTNSEDNNLEQLKWHLVEFFKYLNKVKGTYTVKSTKAKHELAFLLLQLKKQLLHSFSFLNVPLCTRRQDFLCAICSKIIVIEPLKDLWECLETHCHANCYVDVSSSGKLLKDKKEPKGLDSHSHFFETIGSILEEIYSKEETDSHSESSADQMSIKEESESAEENEKSEVAETSDMLFNEQSMNVSSNSINDLCIKSRSWYPKNSLSENTDYKEVDEINVENSSATFSTISQLIPINNQKTPKSFEINEEHITSDSTQHFKTKESPENNFRFNFQSKYSASQESLFYPKLYRKFDLDEDPILQRTGSERSVCLICCCELLNQKSPRNIISHTSGARHSQTFQSAKMRSIVKNYHDTFLSLDKEYQSHQIYFATDDQGFLLRCVVCLKYVRCGDVQAHILSELHKKKLIQLSAENKMHSLFYFLKKHVENYGIKLEISKDVNETEINEKPKRPNFLRHMIVPSIDNTDPSWKKYIPGRFSKHLKYLQVIGNIIRCTVCEKGNEICNWKNIRLHLIQPSHLESTKTQTINYIYHCDVCDKRFHDELTWITHFTDEYERHKEATESKSNDEHLEYECSTCKFVLFGDSEAVKKHKQSVPRRIERKKNQTITLNKEVKEFFSTKTTIRENGEKLLKDAEDVVSKTDIVLKICEDLEDALKPKYNSCKAYPFGSRVSGLGGSQSDLDIFIDIGSMYNGNQNQDEQNQFLIITQVLYLVRKKKEFYQINSRPTARTPIIQLKHRPTDLECDISFVHGLSVENTKFLRYCFELQPASQKLILLLKKWSHLCGLNENITTYALAMLGIFYLQKSNYLLSVQTLKELNRINMTIIGWETIDYVVPKEDILKRIKIFDGDIVELLIGFFKFYSDFNYKIKVICPLLGTEITKDSFSIDPKGSALPRQMSSYVKKISNESFPEYFRCLSHFCVQDPFDLSHNLTKACSGVLLNKFVKLCDLTHSMLTKLSD
ncbi:uncharacterized protein LOC123684998 [Harmonia axyridis]|uniref:uncharacterized protein LOC123684998 n=1 Tax=Harmonia axyridis TaxID=115357 RepID=UPI001E278C2F|nr:uncharacterized protein LOC123684998 [Harmonia axyridis]